MRRINPPKGITILRIKKQEEPGRKRLESLRKRRLSSRSKVVERYPTGEKQKQTVRMRKTRNFERKIERGATNVVEAAWKIQEHPRKPSGRE